MIPKDVEEILEDTVLQAKKISVKMHRTFIVYLSLTGLMLLSTGLSIYKAYRFDKAYDQTMEALDQYNEGVTIVYELVDEMKEVNARLVKRDSIEAFTKNNMNHKEQKELGYFPAGLDAAVKAKFGEETECETVFNIVEMTHITHYKADGPLKEKIDIYIEAFKAGNNELSSRLLSLRK